MTRHARRFLNWDAVHSSVFNETAWFDRWLTREEVKARLAVTSSQNLGQKRRKRVSLHQKYSVSFPARFTGKLHPRHSRRRTGILTAAERHLLQTLGAHLTI